MFVNVTMLSLHGRKKVVRLFVPSLVYHHAAGTEDEPLTALRLSDGQALSIAEPVHVFEARCAASLRNEPEPELEPEPALEPEGEVGDDDKGEGEEKDTPAEPKAKRAAKAADA